MKNYTGFSCFTGGSMARLLPMLCLVFSWSAQATAPRITPQLFGEEKKADIVGYQFAAPLDAAARSESAQEMEIVTEAFKAAGKTPAVDVLPSKQLATYALFNNDAAALMGSVQDLAGKDTREYRVVAFYLKGDKPVSLIFSKKHALGNELYQAFSEGLQKIIKSGKYLEIVEKYHTRMPADYARRLKRHNPSWK